MSPKIAVSIFSFYNILYSKAMPGLEDLFCTIHDLGIQGVEIVSYNILDEPYRFAVMGSGDPDESPTPVFPDGSIPAAPSAPPPDPRALQVRRKALAQSGRIRPSSLGKIQEYLKKYQLTVCNMPLNVGDIGNPDEAQRQADLEALKMWIDIAGELGSPSVRVNSGHVNFDQDGRLDLSICIDSYQKLADYAAPKHITVTMENHGGATERPEACVAIFQGVNRPNFQLTPDFGNFHLGEEMYSAIDKMFSCGSPLVAHVKTYAFGPQYGEGCDSHTDFKRMAQIARAHHYTGWYSIECNGVCGKNFQNVLQTKALIERYFS